MNTPQAGPAATLMLAARHLQVIRIRNLEFYAIGPTQRRVLRLIVANPGITQSRLTLLLKMDKSTVSRLVRKLQRVEMVTKRPSSRDRRTHALYPAHMAKIAARVFDEEASYLDGIVTHDFSTAETEQFHKLLRRASAVIAHVLELPAGSEFPPVFDRPYPFGRTP